jgi:hypothetical protein
MIGRKEDMGHGVRDVEEDAWVSPIGTWICNEVCCQDPVLNKVLHKVRMHNANNVPHELHVMYDITFFQCPLFFFFFFFFPAFLRANSNFDDEFILH